MLEFAGFMLEFAVLYSLKCYSLPKSISGLPSAAVSGRDLLALLPATGSCAHSAGAFSARTSAR